MAKRGKRKRKKRAAPTEAAAPPPTDDRLDAGTEDEEEKEEEEPPRPAAVEPPPARPLPRASAPPSTHGLRAFLYHLFPRSVRRRSLSPWSTWGLGVATLCALAIATLTGVLLMFYYVPSVERAHGSVQDIVAVVPFGRLIRNLHRYAAHAAVICCVLHMLRALLWGAYRRSHARVWLVGVGLLLVTLLTSFSGYLLPWDQDAYWTVTVATSLTSYIPGVGAQLESLLLGGAVVGQSTLIRFHMFHVMALPLLGAILLVIHLFRLRRAGGLARPEARAEGPGEALIPADRIVMQRALTVALVVGIVCVVLAQLWDVRLGPPADLIRPDNPPKAPWFLVGFQEIVSYSALLGGFVFPLVVVAVLALCPWLDGQPCDGAFMPGRFARAALGGSIAFTGAAVVAGVLLLGSGQTGPGSPLNPAGLALLAVLIVPALALVKRRRGVALQTLIAGLVVALTIFTTVGWFFRGPDWRLEYHPGPGHYKRHDPGPSTTKAPAAGRRGER